MEGKLCFEIKWANLTVGRKFAVVACFTLYLRAISEYKTHPPPAGGDLYMEGRLNGRFFALQVRGLIFGGTYTWRGLFSEF